MIEYDPLSSRNNEVIIVFKISHLVRGVGRGAAAKAGGVVNHSVMRWMVGPPEKAQCSLVGFWFGCHTERIAN